MKEKHEELKGTVSFFICYPLHTYFNPGEYIQMKEKDEGTSIKPFDVNNLPFVSYSSVTSRTRWSGKTIK